MEMRTKEDYDRDGVEVVYTRGETGVSGRKPTGTDHVMRARGKSLTVQMDNMRQQTQILT